MNQGIIEITNFGYRTVLDELMEALAERELIYYASILEAAGLGPDKEIALAIEKAMHVCNSAGLPVNKHFKRVFVMDKATRVIRSDWKLSKLACYLTIINSPIRNPLVARTQMEMVSRYIM